MKKFLIVDDHIVVRSGVKLLLLEIFNPAEIHEAGDGESALKKLEELSFDLIIMDIQMPRTDAIALVEFILAKYAGAKILMFSMGSENIYAKRFLKVGAKGFVSKEAPLEEIVKAVNLVLSGKRYISKTLAELLAGNTSEDDIGNPFNKLSAREFEIASLLLAGGTLSKISKSINIQVSTVGTHKTRLFEKLGVTNILELKELATNYNL